MKAVFEYGIEAPLSPFGLMGFGNDKDVKVGHMFCAGNREITWPCGIVGAVIATIFGAIHCVAWSFQFLSHTEQLLWRIASLSITCLPMAAWFAGVGIALVEELDGKLLMVLGWLLVTIITVLFLILYILS
jgi:hypothetical protein